MTVSLPKLGLAYRKAKVDLYYSTNPSLLDIANYEDKLAINLARLMAQLESIDETWVKNPEFLGTWRLAPKQIKAAEKTPSTSLIFASPETEWASITEASKKPIAEFRLMAKCLSLIHI